MIHVVTLENQHLYGRQLESMFRMRHEFYVKQRGWTNLTSSDGRETDEFDNDHAVYLLNLDKYGEILSTFRLNPTTTPYLLGDKLSQYLDGEAPRDNETWDLTRWMVAPHARRPGAGQLADAQKPLICGVMEFAVKRGITHFTTLMDTVFVQRVQKVWPVRPLGQPMRFEDGNGEAIAIEIEAGPHVLAKSRDLTGIFEPVLFELKPSLPSQSTQTERTRAMHEERLVPRHALRSIRTAADTLKTQLSAAQSPEDCIEHVDAFTDHIRSLTRNLELEDA